MPESEEKPELPPKFKLQIDKSLLSKADVHAAQNAGASDIKAVQALNKNIHSGSAGGDQMESLQLVAFEDDGHQRIIAERPKQKGQMNLQDASQVFEYQPQKINNHTFSAGLDYEAAPDQRSVLEKLSAFANAAGARAANPEDWTKYVQSELDKMTGVWEGLNLEKEEVKSSAVAGWNALQDGTVAKFLAQPNAINDPLFKAAHDALSAMAHDPNAVNQKLGALGILICNSSEHYSSLGDREKGQEIGKTMFAMVNPELPKEAIEPLEAVSIENAAQFRAIPDTTSPLRNVESRAGSTAPEIAKTANPALEDAIEPQAGNRGDWPVLNERPSDDVVQQIHENACAAAVGEMVTNGEQTQEVLLEQFKSYYDPETLGKMKYPTATLTWLRNELGQDWSFDFATIQDEKQKLYDFLRKGKTWVAELREQGKVSHIVAVDGLNSQGQIMIRDPAKATRYEMTEEVFRRYWNGRSLQNVRH